MNARVGASWFGVNLRDWEDVKRTAKTWANSQDPSAKHRSLHRKSKGFGEVSASELAAERSEWEAIT